MAIHLISFATATMKGAQRDLAESALAHGVDHVASFGPELVDADFVAAHERILSGFKSRGAGYWLWKPYLILRHLQTLAPEDRLLYLDAGVQVIHSVQPLTQLSSDIVLFKVHSNFVKDWTKRDCLVAMECNEKQFLDQELTNGAFQLYRNTPHAVRFLSDYLRYATRPECLTDEPSRTGPEAPSFREHRHDQSILTLLSLRENITRYRDPSQWGNGCPEMNSPYGQIFHHHRRRY